MANGESQQPRLDAPANTPNPDPSSLTTDALNREVGYLRTLLEAQVQNAREMSEALRGADEKFELERDRRISEVKAESDRRLTEVATEREKALKIKEEADKEALRLDREIRQFKDEKASTRTDDAVKALESRLTPLDNFVSSKQGEAHGAARSTEQKQISFGQIMAMVMAVLFTLSITASVVALILHG